MGGEISVSVFNSLLSGEATESKNVAWSSYSHTIDTAIGFNSASLSMSAASDENARFWIRQGIGARVHVTSQQAIAWEGFVNQVEVTIGKVRISIGPMLDMANRVAVQYQNRTQEALGVSFGGEQVVGTAANDINSQTRYGILEEILSGGISDPDMSLAARDTYLAEFAYPRISRSISAESSQGVSIQCLGYGHFLKKAVYSNPADPADFINASSKISAAVAAEPNGYFLNLANIEANTLQVPASVNDSRTILAVVKDMVALGDVNGNRHIFGVYENRIAEYKQIPTEAEYEFSTLNTDGMMRYYGTDSVAWPSLLRPGKWVHMTGLILDTASGSDSNRTDPSLEFIESVSFSAPNNFSTASGTISKMSQLLARQGLGGLT